MTTNNINNTNNTNNYINNYYILLPFNYKITLSDFILYIMNY